MIRRITILARFLMVLVLISSMAVIVANIKNNINSNMSIILLRPAYADIVYSNEYSIVGLAYSNVGGTLNCPDGKTFANYELGFLGKRSSNNSDAASGIFLQTMQD